MKCTDPDCRCMAHVSPATHYPCCPQHHTPLTATGRLEYGQCESYRVVGRAKAGGVLTIPCHDWHEDDWEWLLRDLFHGADLPPWDGTQPLDLSPFEPPFDVYEDEADEPTLWDNRHRPPLAVLQRRDVPDDVWPAIVEAMTSPAGGECEAPPAGENQASERVELPGVTVPAKGTW